MANHCWVRNSAMSSSNENSLHNVQIDGLSGNIWTSCEMNLDPLGEFCEFPADFSETCHADLLKSEECMLGWADPNHFKTQSSNTQACRTGEKVDDDQLEVIIIISVPISVLTLSQRRRAQNRTAQRAFRDRKAKLVRGLYIRIYQLESCIDSLQKQNAYLTQQLSFATQAAMPKPT